MKHTKDVLELLVRNSLSVAEVIRKLGYKNLDGGTHSHISKQIKKFGIDTSHLLGKARQLGTVSNKRIPWVEILVKDRHPGWKEKTYALRRAMIDSGIEEICGTCGAFPVWNSKPLVLQISHKNGDSSDNRRDNVGFECPNCHSQTDDFGGRSAGKKQN
jgi:hypothetical protein